MTALATTRAATTTTDRDWGRREYTGVFFSLLGLVVATLVAPNISGETRYFEFEPPSAEGQSKLGYDPPSLCIFIGVVFICVGIATIVLRRQETLVKWLQVTAAVLFLPLLMGTMIALSNKDGTNVVNLAFESFSLATPYALGAMTGLWSERSGIVNIGIEGMMLSAAGVGYMAYTVLGEAAGGPWLWVSILIAIATGGLLGALLALMTVTFRMNQIIAGVVINLFALGFTGFIRSEVIVKQGVETGQTTTEFGIPLLKDIPVIGEQLFAGKPIFWMTFVVVFLTWVAMFKTTWGLRVRSAGENPHAAETLGIDVIKIRYQAVILGGFIAGLAGAWFSMEQQARFEDNMTNFSGFIALAALIFGKWRPWGAFAGALLFGFSRAFGARLQILEVKIGGFEIPSEFWQMLPFVLTIIVVAGAVGRAIPPAAEGVPYQRSK